ncbi:MAG: glycine cleavage T C-terminal barrel domain-containing protein [bacterium]
MVDGRQIGHITYCDQGHSVGAVLAAAHIQREFAVEGMEVSVLGQPATVARRAFYDPDGIRLRS